MGGPKRGRLFRGGGTRYGEIALVVMIEFWYYQREKEDFQKR